MTVALFATPILALAQGSNPTGNMGSNRSDTATGTNVDKMAKPGMGTADVQSSVNAPKPSAMAKDNMAPGATGTTVVAGSNSTITGSQTGTSAAKTGQTNTGDGAK